MLKNWIIRFFVVFFMSSGGVSYGQKLSMRHCDSSAIRDACRRIVLRHANCGYPFASVVADSAVIVGRRRVDVYCSTVLSQKYRVENVYLLGGAGLSPYYIYAASGVAPGMCYNESRINSSARRLASSGAVEVMQSAEVEFHPDGVADVYMYLKKRRSNAISAGIALNRDNQDGKYYLTGDALADLRNNFGHGESFRFVWKGYERRSQMLDVQMCLPYMFNTHVSPDLGVNITRSDTTCLTVQCKAAVGVTLSPDVEIKAVADIRRLVSTADDINGNDRNDRTFLYGIAVDCRKIFENDTYINIAASASGGVRKAYGDDGSVADVAATVENMVPIGTWARYEGTWTARQMYFAQKPDIHECIPTGGVGSLRGFADNEIRATGLLSACNTFRVLLPEGFSVQMFYDQAFYRCKAAQADLSDHPCGVGAGVGVRTGAASIDIGWAIGAEWGRMRPLKDAKTLIIIRLDF